MKGRGLSLLSQLQKYHWPVEGRFVDPDFKRPSRLHNMRERAYWGRLPFRKPDCHFTSFLKQI